MNKREILSLKDILNDSLHDLNIDSKIKESRIIESWSAVVGPLIAAHTTEIKIYRKVLYIKLDTPILKNELQFMRQNLMTRLNEVAGGETIYDIIFR
jgi:predicted nucleic acid-binding Zn ribbon protein